MDYLGHNAVVRSLTQAKSLATQSTPNSRQLLKLKAAKDATDRVFSRCLDFNKVSPEIFASVSQYLATLDPAMMDRVCSLTEGINLKTKYAPVVAEFHALVTELEEKDRQYRSAHTTYRRLRDEPVDQPDADRRKAQVKALLADPIWVSTGNDGKPKAPPLEARDFKSADDLQSPVGPPSAALIQLLIDQGYDRINPALMAEFRRATERAA